MSLSEHTGNPQQNLTRVLDEYQEWFSRVMRRIFYPDTAGAQNTAPPESFGAWRRHAGGEGLEDLLHSHEALHNAAEILIQVGSGGNRPEYKEFDGFADLFDRFVIQLRRLERDSLHANLGIDALTGLRSRGVMEQEVERELERRARSGKPFSLVLAHIDDFEKLAGLPADKRHYVIQHAARLIKKCIRSFDDAYRTGDGEFIMALKHTDVSGGVSAINRLRHFLKEEPIQGEGLPKITMSYCTAEPVPGDNVNELIVNMRADLSHYDEGGDMAVEYFEQSPLERFIKSGDIPDTLT